MGVTEGKVALGTASAFGTVGPLLSGCQSHPRTLSESLRIPTSLLTVAVTFAWTVSLLSLVSIVHLLCAGPRLCISSTDQKESRDRGGQSSDLKPSLNLNFPIAKMALEGSPLCP